MSTSSAVLANYVSAMKEHPEEYLGLVVLYSVSETVIAHAALEAHLQRVGLGKFVPVKPADVDVFRRTCTAAQRKRQPIVGEPDQYVNVMVRDVSNGDDEVVKRIVCEIVNKDARRLSYSEVYDLIFTKDTSEVDVRRIGQAVHPSADEVAMEIAAEYRRLVGTVDSACVRTVIGRVLDGSAATSLRPGGGSYFVDRSQADVVAGLEDFAANVAGTMVHSVPLPDDPKQRQNLISAFEDQAKIDIERQVEEIAEILKRGEPVSAQKVATFAARHRSIEERTVRYQQLLESTLGSTRSSLTILKMQMAALAGINPLPVQKAA